MVLEENESQHRIRQSFLPMYASVHISGHILYVLAFAFFQSFYPFLKNFGMLLAFLAAFSHPFLMSPKLPSPSPKPAVPTPSTSAAPSYLPSSLWVPPTVPLYLLKAFSDHDLPASSQLPSWEPIKVGFVSPSLFPFSSF